MVQKFREELRRDGVDAQRMILFGSHARGTADEDSDIDVVVISSDFEGRDLWQRIRSISPAICRTAAPIEAIALTPQEWTGGQSPVVEFAAGGMEL